MIKLSEKFINLEASYFCIKLNQDLTSDNKIVQTNFPKDIVKKNCNPN